MDLRKSKFLYLFVIISLFISNHLFAQEKEEETINKIEVILENLESESGDFDNNTFLEELEFARQKININKATPQELLDLSILNEFQINGIIRYIQAYGEMKSLYELNGVFELSEEDVKAILPFITVSETVELGPKSLKEQFTQGKHDIFIRYQQVLEKQAGYLPKDPESTSTSKYFEGSRPQLYLRHRYKFSNSLSYGITIEKDAGEKLWNNNFSYTNPETGITKKSKNYGGLDYISAHLYLKTKKTLRTLVIGDYQVSFGQGLVIWQGFGFGKTPSVLNVKKKRNPLRPHTSANEINFMRGAALTLALGKNTEATLYASYRKLDANLVTVENDSLSDDFIDVQTSASSIQTSGLHRTISELQNRKSIDWTSTGGNIQWSANRASIGVSGTFHHLSNPINTASSLYQKFNFVGTNIGNFGVNYSYLFNSIHFFGELAFSDNMGFALINGALISTAGINMSVVHRYYDSKYQTLYTDITNIFAEGSRPQNEHGLYTGINFSPFKNATFSGYFDLYKRPWLTYNTNAPSRGLDIFAQFNYQPKRSIDLQIRGKHEIKEANAPNDGSAIRYLVPTKKTSFRIHGSFKLSSNFSLRSRVEWSWFSDGVSKTEKGFLAFQDLTYNSKNEKITVTGRYALFQTDTYNARIYAYESDLLYAFSIPPYYGRGSRYYAMVKWDINRYIDLWVRFSQTFYNDRPIISSGTSEIDGAKKSDIKLQLRIKI